MNSCGFGEGGPLLGEGALLFIREQLAGTSEVAEFRGLFDDYCTLFDGTDRYQDTASSGLASLKSIISRFGY